VLLRRASRRPASGQNRRSSDARSTKPPSGLPQKSCDCSAGRVSSRSAPAHPRPETPSTTAIPGARCAPEVAPLSEPADRPDRRPATPRDAAAPHRSCSTPPPTSPPTARQTAAETDISNWDGTDICTLRLQEECSSDGALHACRAGAAIGTAGVRCLSRMRLEGEDAPPAPQRATRV